MDRLSQIAGGKAAKVPEAWFSLPAGRHLASLERQCLDGMLEGVFGYYAVQVGMHGHDYLGGSPINTKVRVGRSRQCQVRADARNMPFLSSSIDLVLIAHELEFSAHPEAVVREAFRILRPEGQLVIVGFNPAGLYGLRRRLDLGGQYPWHGEFIFPHRVRDWFAVLGLTARHGAQIGFAPPWLAAESDWLRDKFESAGRRWWPMLGGAYVIQAIKRVPAIHRIKPAWSRKAEEAVPAGVVESSAVEKSQGAGVDARDGYFN